MKPILGLFVGDLHVMGDTGLVIPDFPVGSKEQRPYPASSRQRWLKDRFDDLVLFAELLTQEYQLFVGIGGDNVDGVMHHGSTQTYGTPQDQVEMCVALLKPLVSVATWTYGVTGTAAHVGDVGNDDRAVYELLGIEYSDFYQLDVGGRLLWWSHHGLPVGVREHTREDAAIRMIKDIDTRCNATKQRRPDALIGHDKHVSFVPVTVRETSAAVCPCFQFPTYYGMRWPFVGVDIGYLLWHVNSNKIDRVTFEQPTAIKRIGDSRIN